MKNSIVILIISMLVFACNGNGNLSDAYGNFEATEIVVSSEVPGKIVLFDLENGDYLEKGKTVVKIDTVNFYLKGKQLKALKNEISVNTQDVLSQIKVLEEQKNVLLVEKKRVESLIADSAATTKQLDDIVGKVKVLDRQMEAVYVKNRSVLSKLEALNVQMEEVEYNLSKCNIVNPIDGIVLQKYVEPHELVMPGKALYKIADMGKLELKAYIDGTQLPDVKVGQKVKVYIDKTEDENTELEGTISWISSSAEFTPKIIQTKEERVKLVYAIKVLVKNDGRLKIGMPGEVKF
jgi:HlyD family secretion protein